MRTIEQLKTAYDKKKVGEIEKEAKSIQSKSKEFYVTFLELMFYLERTGRYKENPVYKKSRFEQYISFQFGITHSTYMDHRKAYNLFPELSLRYSPSMYASAVKKCGSKKVATVFKEVEAKEQELKRPVRVDEIKQIIHKHQKRIKPMAPRVDVAALQDRVVTEKENVKTLERVVLTKDEQIMKLKATVKRLQSENERLRKENEELMAMMAPIVDHFSDADDRSAVGVQ